MKKLKIRPLKTTGTQVDALEIKCRNLQEKSSREAKSNEALSKRQKLIASALAALEGEKNSWAMKLKSAAMEFGVKALGTCPVKGIAADPGVRDVPVSFAGVTIMPGNFIYSDLDGIIVSNTDLMLGE